MASITLPAGRLGADAADIAGLCAVLGITQTSLARVLGTTPRTVTRWKRGQSEPHAATARRLRELARLRWLMETLVDPGGSRRWMHSPNEALRGRAPVDLLEEGRIETVVGLLEAVGEGGLF